MRVFRGAGIGVGALLWAVSAAALPLPARRPVTERPVSATGIPAGEGPLYATLQTSLGRVVVRLYEDKAPRTVTHFVGLATGAREWRHPATGEKQLRRPLYDGTLVHRAIPLFMVQMGDPLSHPRDGDPSRVGTGEPGFRLEDEFAPGLRFDRPGLVAMAGTDTPDGAGCQFFITEVALPHLDGRHAIFGEVERGFELVPKIARHATHPVPGKPVGPVVLERVTISRGRY